MSIAFTSRALPAAIKLRNRIHDHHARPECVDLLVNRDQMHLQACRERTLREDPQQPAVEMRPQIDADRAHVADDLLGAIPRRRNTARARRARRPPRASAPRSWFCRCRRCPTSERCCRDNSRRRPASRPGPARRCEITSLETLCRRPSEVIGRTENPCSSMRNGYSLVPWVLPRYLTTRRRRVEI